MERPFLLPASLVKLTFLTHCHDSGGADLHDADLDDADLTDADNDDIDDADDNENQVVRAGGLVARILVMGKDKPATQSSFHHHHH